MLGAAKGAAACPLVTHFRAACRCAALPAFTSFPGRLRRSQERPSGLEQVQRAILLAPLMPDICPAAPRFPDGELARPFPLRPARPRGARNPGVYRAARSAFASASGSYEFEAAPVNGLASASFSFSTVAARKGGAAVGADQRLRRLVMAEIFAAQGRDRHSAHRRPARRWWAKEPEALDPGDAGVEHPRPTRAR